MLKRLQRKILLQKKVLGLILLLMAGVSYGQTTLSGNVTDPDGVGLPGATVFVEGTNTGTTTDVDGNFTVTAPSQSKNLVISFVGYATKVVPIGSKTSFTVELDLDTETLSEVVVVGYGTQKRTDLTGSIASASAEIIQERGTTNPVQALQGSVAGVNITNSTGRVGDSFEFTVRGKSSLEGGNNPLFVVDGVITDNIDFLNPNDIAKIDILKDASSQAIYGSRGSNGVVFIQTKGGASIPSGTNISVDTYYGVKKVARLPKMMSPEKWRDYHYSAYLGTTNNGAGMTEQEFNDVVASPSSNQALIDRFNSLEGFDWYDAVLKDALQSNTNININHRNGGSAYTLGIGYQTETGNMENEGLDKFNLRLGMDQEVSDKWKAGAQVNMALSVIERGSEVGMREAFRMNPFLRPWAVDENGNDIIGEYFPQPGKLQLPSQLGTNNYVLNKTSTWNPILEINNSNDETRQWNMIGSTYLQYSPVEWLTFKSTLSSGLKTYRRGWFSDLLTNSGNSQGINSQLEKVEDFNFTLDNQANVTKSFGNHDFNLLLLQSTFVRRIEGSELGSTNQPFAAGFYNIGSAQTANYTLGSWFRQNQLLSYAVRLNYTFNDKYLITLTNRWDGSSLLAEGLQWESFPSVALGWQLSEESFMRDIQWLPTLKLRAGYGQVGNNVVDPYSAVNNLDQTTYYDFNGSVVNGFIASSLANEKLTWEVTTETNVGLDFALFNYRVSGSFDFYDRLTDGQLLEQDLPLETGFDAGIKSNAGEVRNRGVEIQLNTINIQNNLVSWETSFAFTRNKNTIESIYGRKESDIGNGWHIGESVDALYYQKFDGIWQAEEAAEAASYNAAEGNVKLVDVDNDGDIDPDDRVILGSEDPSWTLGLTSRLKVSSFDFTVSLYKVQDVFVYSNWHANFVNMSDRGRAKFDVPSWYVPANEVGVTPQRSNEYPQPRNTGSFTNALYYRDASFLKVQNISLGYTLPVSVLNKIGIDYTRVFVNILNPFVFTDYEGWDPEYADASYNIQRVSSVTTQFGLNLKF
ncbi:MAG: SusC/RagA family TonB-linked outer membrane protein [Cyclobacteriaceae bacterium]|nr:SusC/RagA family TonB-linked outer membrane protein [Cyclobacteriaceae bacterium SS2]